MLTDIQKQLLAEIADLHKVPEGAYNIRANGVSAAIRIPTMTACTASSSARMRM